MNPQMRTQAQAERPTYSDITVIETDLLAGWGFDPHEIVSLLWLRQWYQNGGSDRATMVRHLEFLRLLVQSGELELQQIGHALKNTSGDTQEVHYG